MSLIITGTTSTAGITLVSANNPVFVTPGTYIFGTTSTALYGGNSATWTITNSGQINAASFGVSLKAGGIITNKASSAITAGTDGIYAANGALTVSNAGYIRGSNTINGYGIKVVGAAASAQIANLATGTIIGGYGGVYMPSGSGAGTISNAGFIRGIKFGGVIFNGGGNITNVATGTITGQEGIAISGSAGTVANAGTIQGAAFQGVILGNGGTVTNSTGGLIAGAQNGVQIAIAAGTIRNAGSISGGTGKAVALSVGGTVTNLYGGTMTGGTGAVYNSSGALTVSNAGYIRASTALTGYGIKARGATTISNLASGTIIGAYGGIYTTQGAGAATLSNAGLIQGGGFGAVDFGVGGGVTNLSGGRISGSIGVIFGLAAGTLVNAGTIQATALSAAVLNAGGTVTNAAAAVMSAAQNGAAIFGAAGTVNNFGTISGTTGKGVWLSVGGTVTNQAGGTISGGSGVYTTGGAGTVINAGSITGNTNAVVMAAGNANRVIVDQGGAFSGTVSGGNTIGAAAVSTLELAATGGLTGQISGLGAQFINFAQVVVDATANWTLEGTNTLVAGTTLTNAGLLTIFNGSLGDAGLVVNNGHIVDDGSLTIGTLSGAGQVLIDANSTLTTGGAVAASETIVFNGGGGLLNLTPAGFAGVIQGFESGDAIALTGISNATSAGIVNGNTLVVSLASGGPISLVLAPDQVYANQIFAIEAPGGAFGTNDFIAVTGSTGPTIIGQGSAMMLTGLQATSLAAVAGGLGGITVSGANSLLTTTSSSFAVGDTSVGSLAIETGGTVASAAGAVITNSGAAAGSAVNVSGSGSNWQVSGALVVGNAGHGNLSLSQGATVTASSLNVGAQAGSDGVVAVTGTGSALNLAGAITLGNQAAGELSILGGGQVTAQGLTVGNASALSSGNVDVEGVGSTLLITAGGALNIGFAGGGSGSLTIGAGAVLNYAGTIVESGLASLNNTGGIIDPDAVLFTTATNAGDGLNEYNLYVSNISAVQVSSGSGIWDAPLIMTGTSQADAANNINVNGDVGQWQVSQSGTLTINANTIDAGQAIVFEDATGTLVIGQVVNGGSAGTAGVIPTITAGAMNLLQAGGFRAGIWGYRAGDKILFNNLTVLTDSIVGGNTIDLFGAGGALLGALTFFSTTGVPLTAASANMLAAAVQIAPAIANTAIFTAHVYNDGNANSIQDGGDPNLPGVTVNLENGTGTTTLATGTTDLNGNISFTGLAPGSYEVAVVTPAGNVVTQQTNVATPETLTSGQTANAIEGVYAPGTIAAPVIVSAAGFGLLTAGSNQTQVVPTAIALTAGAGRIVTLRDNGSVIGTGTADGAGNVTISTTGYIIGNNTLTATASDGLGNTSIGSAATTLTLFSLAVTSFQIASGNGRLLLGDGDNAVSVGTSGTVDISTGNGNNDVFTAGATASVTLGNGGNVVIGGSGNDVVNAGSGSNNIYLGNGNDRISAGGGADSVYLGNGSNTITLGGGTDQIQVGGGANTITVGNGNDYIQAGGGNNIVNAGTGTSGIQLGDGNNTVTVTGGADTIILGNGTNSASLGASISFLRVGNGSNTITATSGNEQIDIYGNGTNSITLGSGNNLIYGGGNNTINLGGGNNVVSLTDGADTITSGNGTNTVTLYSATQHSTVTLGNGNNTVISVNGGATVTLGSGNNYVEALGGNNTITVGNGSNVVKGDSGNDVFNVGAGFVHGNGATDVFNLGSGGGGAYGGWGVNSFNISAGAWYIGTAAGSDQIRVNGASAFADIQLFDVAKDMLVLSNAAFGLGVSGLTGGATQAVGALLSTNTDGSFTGNALLAYNVATGVLYDRADTSSAGVAVAAFVNAPSNVANRLFVGA